MKTKRKIGDRIYWQYFNSDKIGSATIKEIKFEKDEEGNEFEIYVIYKNENYSESIEDFNCLDEDNPLVCDYIEHVGEYVSSALVDICKKVFGEEGATEENKKLVEKIILAAGDFNIQEGLKEVMNYR